MERDITGTRQARLILRHLVIDGQLAFLGQQQDAGAGELLGHGADGERGVRLDGGPSSSKRLPYPLARTTLPSRMIVSDSPA